jgi:hypothetical protein
LKKFLTGAALLPLVIACGEVRPAHQEAVATDTTRGLVATYAVGTQVTSEGAISQDSAGDSFRRGPGLFLAIDVASATTDQKIQVDWVNKTGQVVHRDIRNVGEGTRYADFSSGDTSAWIPGPYRAVIRINDRVVNETRFALM